MPARPYRTWPGSEAYDYLETARSADLAWEWLRRNLEFQKLVPGILHRSVDGLSIAEAASPECTARWGCLHVPDPDLRFIDTVVLWSADVDPSVLRVIACPATASDPSAFHLQRWALAATLVIGAQDRRSLLLRAPGGSLRMDILGGAPLSGPVTLLHDLTPVRDVERAIAALHRYLGLARTGVLPACAPPATPKTRRLIDALRVHDVLAEGASIRDVGVVLFGAERVRAEWPGRGEALKSHSRRMIGFARYMVGGGYKTLLH